MFVGVGVRVRVGVFVGVGVGLGVWVGVAVGLGVKVNVGVIVGVAAGDGVAQAVTAARVSNATEAIASIVFAFQAGWSITSISRRCVELRFIYPWRRWMVQEKPLSFALAAYLC